MYNLYRRSRSLFSMMLFTLTKTLCRFLSKTAYSPETERETQGYAFYAARGLALFLHQSDHMRSFHRRFLGLLRKTISPVLALRSIPRLETDEPPFILVSPPHPPPNPFTPARRPPIRPSTLSLFFPKNRTSEHGPPPLCNHFGGRPIFIFCRLC